jgi:hypothetical protein
MIPCPRTEEDLNLATEARTQHILKGDATGGGHRWPGLAGKTPFPASWSSTQIMNSISDIATDPAALAERGDLRESDGPYIHSGWWIFVSSSARRPGRSLRAIRPGCPGRGVGRRSDHRRRPRTRRLTPEACRGDRDRRVHRGPGGGR